MNDEVKLCIAFSESLRPKVLGNWLSPRIPGALLCISLYNCYFTCEVVVVRYFCLSCLIEYDKTLSIISAPKTSPKST